MSYILVNPYNEEKGITSAKKLKKDIAEDIWSQLSSNIKNYTPEFYFTFQNNKNKKLYHYKVSEEMESGRVKYSLKEFKNKNLNESLLLNNINQDGGKHHHKKKKDSSDSSSSSSQLLYSFPNKTKGYYLTYYPTIYGVPNIILPTFTQSFTPYVRISTG